MVLVMRVIGQASEKSIINEPESWLKEEIDIRLQGRKAFWPGWFSTGLRLFRQPINDPMLSS
jgi:hypothetical protein